MRWTEPAGKLLSSRAGAARWRPPIGLTLRDGEESRLSDRDIATLTGTLVPFAQQMLRQHGEFYPFAATIDKDGAVAQVAGDIGSERPGSAEMIAFLQGA